jgi:uncharacterized membrane protein
VKPQVHTVLLAGSAFWCLSILAAPAGSFSAIYDFFKQICHQNPARSWEFLGAPLPVCIRCTSIYFGFFAALLIRLRVDPRWLCWCIGLSLVEFALGHLVFDSEGLRSLTGFLLGAAAAPFVARGVEEMWRTFREPV